MGTVFVAGIYGVGKSTLCKQLSSELKVPTFSASELISAVNGEEYGANKAVADKLSNQEILILEVKRLLNAHQKILLAGHFCIFTKDNAVDRLPEAVFSGLRIEQILLLLADVSRIGVNLSTRDNKIYSIQQISDLQGAEIEMAHKISKMLKCKLNTHTMSFDDLDFEECLGYIQSEE